MGTVSTYEAKARFSEILRRVRAGERIVVTHRGEPVVEIRPVAAVPSAFDERVRWLAQRGAIVRAAPEATGTFAAVGRARGALARLLAERDEE